MDPFTSATDLAAAIRRREVSPVEAVTASLDRIEALGPQLNAFCHVADDDALATARTMADELANGWVDELPPFFGVPLPVKELNRVAGWVSRSGSRATPNRAAATDDLVVTRFREAGFVLVGLTTSPEFGTVSVTESALHGPTRNPWSLDHTPGGSSGGAAAAVAAGLVPIAHASDGGGSIRIPASCCGLVGLKPSRGRVPNGVVELEGAATSGVVSRTVADTAAVLDVIGRPDPGAWWNAPAPARPFAAEVGADPGRLRIAVTTTPSLDLPVVPACTDAVRAAADLLSGCGHDVFEHPLQWPAGDEAVAAFMTLWNTGTALYEGLDEGALEPLNAALRTAGQGVDSLAYVRAVAALQVAGRVLVSQWGRDFDVLLTPTMAIEPPRVGWLWEGAEDDPMVAMLHAYPMAIFTSMFNVSGQPAVSLPVHTSAAGLPVGVQLVGAPWDEATLVRVAAQAEAATGWPARVPPGPWR